MSMKEVPSCSGHWLKTATVSWEYYLSCIWKRKYREMASTQEFNSKEFLCINLTLRIDLTFLDLKCVANPSLFEWCEKQAAALLQLTSGQLWVSRADASLLPMLITSHLGPNVDSVRFTWVWASEELSPHKVWQCLVTQHFSCAITTMS